VARRGRAKLRKARLARLVKARPARVRQTKYGIARLDRQRRAAAWHGKIRGGYSRRGIARRETARLKRPGATLKGAAPRGKDESVLDESGSVSRERVLGGNLGPLFYASPAKDRPSLFALPKASHTRHRTMDVI